MTPLRPRRLSFFLVSACLSAAAFATQAQATCPSNAPVTCGDYCCPYGEDGRTDVCCANQTCTADGTCGAAVDAGMCPSHAPISCSFGCCPKGEGGLTTVCCADGTCTRSGYCGGSVCPTNAPIACAKGCCPLGINGEENVCCPDGTCTSDGQCAGNGTSSQCPSNAPVACDVTCCPYEHDGGTSVCCADNTCTADGQCEGITSTGTLSDGGACPLSANVSCGEHCCPPGENGRTDVCCSDGGCTTNGNCSIAQPDAGTSDASNDAMVDAPNDAADAPASDAADAGASGPSTATNEDDGGCGCVTAGSNPGSTAAWLLFVVGVLFAARRKR